MPKSPYYKVLIKSNNRDISGLISTFKYEQTIEKDDVLTLIINNATTAMVDDDDLQEGKLVEFRFGYLQLKHSRKYLGRISNVEPRYEKTISITMNITDLGPLLKKDDVDKVWENQKVSDIAKEIAKKHGLKANVFETLIEYDVIPQGGKTDYEFMKYLTTFPLDLPLQFWIDGDVLNLAPRQLRKASAATYTWNDGRGKVLGFFPSSMETKKKGGSKETEVVGVDPFTGNDVSKKANADTVKNDEKLDDYPVHYNINGKEVFNKQSERQTRSADNRSNATGRKIIIPVQNDIEAENVANKAKKDAELGDIKAELSMEGDPAVEADRVITVNGVGEKFSGNWYAHTVVHSIDTGGYITTQMLKRNASRKANLEDEDAVKANDDVTNKSVGTEDEEPKKKVDRVNFDINGVAQ